MDFKTFKSQVQEKLKYLTENSAALFVTDTDKDKLWETYLGAFPAGSDPIHKNRTHHDCSCCRQWLKNMGNVVGIIGNETVTIWDIATEYPYQSVANALNTYVGSRPIRDIFVAESAKIGTDKNYQETDSGVREWQHFYCEIPKKFVAKSQSIESQMGEKRSTKDVIERSLQEITLNATETVLDLINSNNLYRGEEHLSAVDLFKTLQEEHASAKNKNNFYWECATGNKGRIRNTAIGTLLVDISEGMDLEDAVIRFEKIMAPQNYKRPKTLFTTKMVEDAKSTLKEMGLEGSLGRRFARFEDVSVNNVLWVNRNTRKTMKGFFDETFDSLAQTLPQKTTKGEEIFIQDFIDNVLPNTTELEVYFENRHENRLFSLIAAENESPSLFKWDNGFSWAYNNDTADSIKQMVADAGGKVDGELRCSLQWFNYDDLDLHIIEPNGTEIYYSSFKKPSIAPSSGQLDVDMNAGSGQTRKAVENITWGQKSKMQKGTYQLVVHNFCKREPTDIGFVAEIECQGKLFTFPYNKAVLDKQKVLVAKFRYSENGVEILESIPTTQASKTIWGIPTMAFHKVSSVMYSPNHWDGNKTGNRHWFFTIEGCLNPTTPRGFFNEFLKEELTPHRKVFEILGDKTKTQPSTTQISGIGVSTTQDESLIMKADGRTYIIKTK